MLYFTSFIVNKMDFEDRTEHISMNNPFRTTGFVKKTFLPKVLLNITYKAVIRHATLDIGYWT